MVKNFPTLRAYAPGKFTLSEPLFSHLMVMKEASELSEGKTFVLAILLLPQTSRVFP